jgi:hypothetical protein
LSNSSNFSIINLKNNSTENVLIQLNNNEINLKLLKQHKKILLNDTSDNTFFHNNYYNLNKNYNDNTLFYQFDAKIINNYFAMLVYNETLDYPFFYKKENISKHFNLKSINYFKILKHLSSYKNGNNTKNINYLKKLNQNIFNGESPNDYNLLYLLLLKKINIENISKQNFPFNVSSVNNIQKFSKFLEYEFKMLKDSYVNENFINSKNYYINNNNKFKNILNRSHVKEPFWKLCFKKNLKDVISSVFF